MVKCQQSQLLTYFWAASRLLTKQWCCKAVPDLRSTGPFLALTDSETQPNFWAPRALATHKAGCKTSHLFSILIKSQAVLRSLNNKKKKISKCDTVTYCCGTSRILHCPCGFISPKQVQSSRSQDISDAVMQHALNVNLNQSPFTCTQGTFKRGTGREEGLASLSHLSCYCHYMQS